MKNYEEVNIAGTKGYIPPEVFDPKQITFNVGYDVFSLGIMFYELLAKTTPDAFLIYDHQINEQQDQDED